MTKTKSVELKQYITWEYEYKINLSIILAKEIDHYSEYYFSKDYIIKLNKTV